MAFHELLGWVRQAAELRPDNSAARISSQASPHAASEASARPGAPLEPGVRATMEQRFGHDFGAVRVHHDSNAASAADAHRTAAFTLGEDIHFANGRYQPGVPAGQALLAHELAHTVQQSAASRAVASPPLLQSIDGGVDARGGARGGARVDSAAERDASLAATRIMNGQPPGALASTALGVACAPARQPKGTSGHLGFDNGWSYIVYENEVRLRYYHDLPKAEAEARAKKKLPGFIQVGTIPWVTNNPGNITQTAGAAAGTLQGFPATPQMGSIGTYGGRYSIFDSQAAGVDAIGTYLRKLPTFGTNKTQSLASAIKQYKGEEPGEKARRVAREEENAKLAKDGKPLLPRIDVREDYLADVTKRSQDRIVAGEAMEVGETPDQLSPSQSREVNQGAKQRVGDLLKTSATDIDAGDATLAPIVESIHEVEGKAAAPGVRFSVTGFDDPSASAPYDGQQKRLIKALLGSESARNELQTLLGSGP